MFQESFCMFKTTMDKKKFHVVLVFACEEYTKPWVFILCMCLKIHLTTHQRVSLRFEKC